MRIEREPRQQKFKASSFWFPLLCAFKTRNFYLPAFLPSLYDRPPLSFLWEQNNHKIRKLRQVIGKVAGIMGSEPAACYNYLQSFRLYETFSVNIFHIHLNHFIFIIKHAIYLHLSFGSASFIFCVSRSFESYNMIDMYERNKCIN